MITITKNRVSVISHNKTEHMFPSRVHYLHSKNCKTVCSTNHETIMLHLLVLTHPLDVGAAQEWHLFLCQCYV